MQDKNTNIKGKYTEDISPKEDKRFIEDDISNDEEDTNADESDEEYDDNFEIDFTKTKQAATMMAETKVVKAKPEYVPPVKKSKLNKKELYKPPTSEELNQLKETENLYHSSLFRLQVRFNYGTR